MPKRWGILALLLLCFVVKTQAQEEKVIFSANGGFYESSFELSLYCYYANHHVRYTTNGNTPDAGSPLFEEPLQLDRHLYSNSDIYTIQISPDDLVFIPDSVQHAIVIRAAVFDENDRRISEVATNSYFLRSLGCDTHGLPVVSLCADSLDLFDYQRGIFVPGIHFKPDNPHWSGNYYQEGRDWEREVNVEFYELDNTGINQKAGLRTHGGNGRRYPQKNLTIYAREDYGKKRFKHPFFETISINSFKHLQLKPFCSAWTPAGLQDPLCQAIASQSLEVESLATRPAVLFLNGEYWGIYFIHEKPDERYLEDHFNVDLDRCSIMGSWNSHCDYGNGDDFNEMMYRVERFDLSDPTEYQLVEDFFDLDSFIDYQVLEMFLGNSDWPANNMRCWHEGNGKWRWIFYDGDGCLTGQDYDVFANATYFGNMTWPTNSQATLLFRRLLANESFRIRFFDRFRELLGSRFQYAETRNMLTQLQNELWDEIPSQSERFGMPCDMVTWIQRCGQIDDFLRQRPSNLADKLEQFIQDEPWNNKEWVCYPNPTSGLLSLTFTSYRAENELLNIYDVTGRCVYSSREAIHLGSNDLTLDIDLPAGVYLITLGEHSHFFVKH